ncbi:dodecin domain-containing protein [Streptosporangium lutulentum]
MRNGIRRASQTLRHLDWFEVTEVEGTSSTARWATSRSG